MEKHIPGFNTYIMVTHTYLFQYIFCPVAKTCVFRRCWVYVRHVCRGREQVQFSNRPDFATMSPSWCNTTLLGVLDSFIDIIHVLYVKFIDFVRVLARIFTLATFPRLCYTTAIFMYSVCQNIKEVLMV